MWNQNYFTLTMNISMHHLIPWWQLDYHTDSNNSEPKIWLQHCWKLIQNFKMVWFFILLFREIKIYRSWHQLYPSITSWCARDTNVNPLLWLKVSEISWKNGFIFWKKCSQKNLHIVTYYCMHLPGQRYILLLSEKYPNHLGHPDQTWKIFFSVKSKEILKK